MFSALFQDFANVWTPVAYAKHLHHDRPLKVTVAGTSVVLFRDEHGLPAALLDRCPHRGAALSLGKVDRGCIQCPFHGWTFDRSGACVRVPWNPDAKRSNLDAVAVPVRELAGQIWVHTSVGSPPDEPAVHESLIATDVRLTGIEMTWRAHWTRVMENMLDWPHVPFVHPKTIGRNLASMTDERMDTEMEEHSWGWRVRTVRDGVIRPGLLDFRWPNQMNLHIPARGRTFTLAVACVPVDHFHTRLLLLTARNFARWPPLDLLFNRSSKRIANEDRAITESSDPVEVPAAADEKSVRTDAPTLRFRKSYFARLKGRAIGEVAAPPHTANRST